MTRKVVLFIAMSLDGYIARKNGSIDWLELNVMNKQEDSTYDEFYKSVDTVIMGRTTYDQVVSELSPDVYPYADAESYVLTSRPGDSSEKIHFTDEDVTDLVSKLKQSPGDDIWIVGGQSVITPLIQNNLIDEYQITIVPMLLGEGIPLFKPIENEIELRQVGCYVLNQLTYLTFIRV
ncbi:dihydrofolate reductase family protein [Marinilactibacillus piezotolerans]|uniref:dihydrofolate reductase family protein n=1 Tax=Marinilactibacillus piezotolerans TaxID=258723 RepID=UPI0009B18F8C|nr:dihydrofolate reductase family protein [Marinilactibacillus piezotolerans]